MEVSDDAIGVRALGHRSFVGGDGEYWQRIGALQFEFMKSRGLRPEHVLLDFACGSLRGGVHFVPYLEPGNYLGFDKSIDLVVMGVVNELGHESFVERRPQFVLNGRFDLSEFTLQPDFVIAQSIFTHLNAADITRALAAMRAIAKPSTEVFATYFAVEAPVTNAAQSHSRVNFRYTAAEMDSFGRASGWRFDDVGAWNHPRGQLMARYHLG
ncbi:MAG: hypothetical protein ACO3QC_03285 [Phycisphaerales bacterium]